MSFNLVTWYKEITKTDTLFSYKGIMSDTKISMILDNIDKIFEKKSEETKKVKKIYNVAIETLQNLYHHSDNFIVTNNKDNYEENNTVFVLKQDETGLYHVVTGNFIKKSNIRLLKERIDQLNFLNKDEVKILYRLILNNDQFSDKGGGGLGIIDLVKKSGNKLGYDFYYFNADYIFFTLTIAI